MKKTARLSCNFIAMFITVLVLGRQSFAAEPPSITIDMDKPGSTVPDPLWRIFFEEINHTGKSGLYGELVENGDFVTTNNLPGWSFVAEGGAAGEMAQDSYAPLNETNTHYLKLTVKNPGTRCGIANSGFWGMNIHAGDWYDLTFFARADATESGRGIGLMVSLESDDGKKVCARATIPEIGGPTWREFHLALQARQSDPKARMVISMEETATVMLDCVSLFPRCPEVVLPTTVDGAEIGSNRTGDTNQVQVRRIYALAGLDQKRHEVVIKVMNPAAKDVSASISLKGATKLGNSATASTLAHSNPAAKNSLDKPGVVVPKESSFKPAGAQFTYDFAPNSFTILRLPLANN
jgi:hypothetical protein